MNNVKLNYINFLLLNFLFIGFVGADSQDFVASNSKFAINIYQELSTKNEGNIFISPYSISTAFGMLYAGAKDKTASQMAEVLKFSSDSTKVNADFFALQDSLNQIGQSGKVNLNIANSLWPQKESKILTGFLNIVEKNYNSTIQSVDYLNDPTGSSGVINKWVEEKTEDRIKNLIPEDIDRLTKLIIVNTIYFKGTWQTPFKKEYTEDEYFITEKQAKVKTPFMKQTEFFPYGEAGNMQLLELPYASPDLSMLVILPGDDLNFVDLEKQLSVERLEGWRKTLSNQKVAVSFPKIKMKNEFKLKPTLQALGMTLPFTDRADFSGVDGQKTLFIDSVLHQTFLEIDEQGTEAAAATALLMIARSAMQPEPKQFIADHPFLFLIQEKSSGAILFMGKVGKPAD
jgi:serpin B